MRENNKGYNLPLALLGPVENEHNIVFRNKNMADFDWVEYATNNIFFPETLLILSCSNDKIKFDSSFRNS